METLSESDRPEYLKWLDQNKESFPEGTSDEKAVKFFLAERSRIRQRENERIMNAQAIEIEAERNEAIRLRTHRAINALSEDNIIEKFRAAYRLSHVGHDQVLRAIVYAECLKSSCTTKGLQPAITGQRGSGKSHAVRTTVHLLPQDAVYTGTHSPKALYYKNPDPKMTFYMDDASLNEEMVSLMKRKQTEFQQKTTYDTVDNKKSLTLVINPRMVFITTSVSQLGDEQLSDRALVIDIKNEKADDDAFHKFEQERRSKGLPEFQECEEVNLCRDILSHIRSLEFRVLIPKIDFAYYHDRRLMEMVYDLMEASAILNYRHRKHEKVDGIIIINAAKDDLANALDFDMFKFSDSETFSRMTKSERAFDERVQSKINGAGKLFTERELAEAAGTSVPAVRNFLYGRGNSSSTVKDGVGLVGKTKWYSPDLLKDAEAVKIHIYVTKHEFSKDQFAFFANVE